MDVAGVPGGKFLERGRVKKSQESTSSGRRSEGYYSAADFYVGATLDFNRYRFVIIDADEYAFNYMEQHREQVSFRHSSFESLEQEALQMQRDRATRHKCELSHVKRLAVGKSPSRTVKVITIAAIR